MKISEDQIWTAVIRKMTDLCIAMVEIFVGLRNHGPVLNSDNGTASSSLKMACMLQHDRNENVLNENVLLVTS